MKQVDSYNKVIFTHNEKPQKKINCLTKENKLYIIRIVKISQPQQVMKHNLPLLCLYH